MFALAGLWSAAWLPLSGTPAGAQEPKVPLRCETFCSPDKLRTAVARLIWVDPAIEDEATRAAGVAPAPEIDTTVFKEGFEEGLFASFPTAEPGTRAAPAFAPSRDAAGALRAFDLQVTGVVAPQIRGAPSLEMAAPAAAQRETSVTVENLEPGLEYRWRLRFSSERESEVVVCVAPICVADMREGN
jgi:hypothetical protein